jgi:DNA end-binding protein Ku
VPRSIWSGSITFGLVTVPVGLYSATEDHGVHFHQYQRGTTDRIRNRRVNERTGEEVPYSDIVRGQDEGDGEIVIVEPAELDQIAPGRSRSIDVTAFVDLDEIDHIHFQKTYWLAPHKAENGKVYALLAAAMAATNRVAVASFVMRGKQYLCAVRAQDGVLSLETLYYADEIRDARTELDTLPEQADPDGRELDMARTLIESMSAPWRPEDYRDTYTDAVRQLVEDKRAGNDVVAADAVPEATDVTDLLDALRRSVEARRGPVAGPSEDLSGLTKEQLLERARELDIPGRSGMNHDELAAAVAEAGATGAAARAS